MTQETDGMYHSRTSRPILVDNAVQSGVVGRRGVGIRFDEEGRISGSGRLEQVSPPHRRSAAAAPFVSAPVTRNVLIMYEMVPNPPRRMTRTLVYHHGGLAFPDMRMSTCFVSQIEP